MSKAKPLPEGIWIEIIDGVEMFCRECPKCKESILLESWHSVAQCKKCGTLMRTINWKKKG